MNKNFEKISEKAYDLEMDFEQVVMLSDIIKSFGEYSSDVRDGAEKMLFLSMLLSDKCSEYKTLLAEFVEDLQDIINK